MKEIARLRNLSKRNSLSRQQVGQKSRLIAEKLLVLPEFRKAKRVLLYFGVGNEVETKAIIEKALQQSKSVALPVTNFANKTITPTEIASLEELKKTRQGLLEPPGQKAVKIADLQLIVVPGVAFDRTGSRIGRGNGFYDSLLRKTSTSVPIVGLCFDENLEELLPSESHDVKMDIVVTDKEVFRCKE